MSVASSPASAPVLVVRGLSKSYGSVLALRAADVTLFPGEVLALVGENGAGKSTVARCVAGLARPDAGSLDLAGCPYTPASRREAEGCGVRMVMQELNLVPTLSVAENLFLDRLPHRLGWIDRRRLSVQAAALLNQVGLSGLDPGTEVGSLGVGVQQMIEIAAALSQDCRILILDEPTAALTQPEVDRLFSHIARLRASGTAVLYISHRMEEIRRIADRVTVLRDGAVAAASLAPDTPLATIVRAMAGRDLYDARPTDGRRRGADRLRVQHLCRGTAVRDVSFAVCAGEILGVAGLMGAGRTEMVRAVFGADRPDSGRVFLAGSDRPARIHSPADAVRQGLALLPEDRKTQALLMPLSVRANITLNSLARFARRPFGLVRQGLEADAARTLVDRLAVRCSDDRQPAGTLSGGNQQKVALARWLCRDCNVLIVDEPTRGVDIGARFEIYDLLRRLAGDGKAIVVVSSDMKELLTLCDRILVMSSGRVAATFDHPPFDQDAIMAAALSEHLQRRAGMTDTAP